MKSNRTIISTLLFVALFFNAIQLAAQDAPMVKITPSIVTGVKTPVVDNRIYTIKGSTLSYSINTEGTGKLENGIWQLYHNGQKKTEGTGTGSLTFPNLEVGEYTLSYKACRYWAKDTITEMRDTVVISGIPIITVYETPSAIKANAIQDAYHDRTFTLGVSASGAAPDGWSFEWTKNGAVISGETGSSLATKISNTGTNTTTGQFQVTAINRCHGVEFARINLSYNVTVYPKLVVEQINNNIKVNNKTEFTLSANAVGGYPGNTTHAWFKDGAQIAEGATLVHSENNTSEGEKQYKYILRTTNWYNNETWDVVDTEYTITVSGISISQKNSDTMQLNAYSGKDFTLAAVAECASPSTLVYEWKKTNGTVIGNSAEITHKENNTGSAPATHLYTITVKNVKDGTVIDSASETFTVTLYPKINVNYTTAADTIICGNSSLKFGIKTSGGNPSGWEYEWYRDGILLQGKKDSRLNIEETNSSTSYISHTYKVVAKNIYNDEEWDRKELAFSARIYPDVYVEEIIAPDAVVSFYINGTQQLGANFKGGYDEEGAWSFKWYVNNSPINNATGSVYTHNEENLTSSAKVYEYMLVATNKLNNRIIYQRTTSYRVNVYSAIKAEYNSASDTVISGEKQIFFKVKTSGGYETGWTYQWYRDNMLLNGYDSEKLTYKETNNSTTSECLNHTYKVVAINTCNGTEFDRTEMEYRVKVYPKITSPSCSADMLDAHKFAEGALILIGAEPGLGGNVYGWTYKWSDMTEGKKMDEQGYSKLRNYIDVKHNYKDSLKTIRQKQYKLEYTNVSPEGQLLDKGSFVFSVKIYRKPMKPIELIRKGKSNIYIADMRGYITSGSYSKMAGFTDTQLAELGYKFLFGYGEDNELATDKAMRYAIYTDAQISQLPWVRTYWVYDDGFVTASEKFHYGDTRGGVTGISENAEDGDIKIEKNCFSVSLSSPAPATVNIYSINGAKLKSCTYEAQEEFNETIETDFMDRGIYIIEVIVGNRREIRKFVVE